MVSPTKQQKTGKIQVYWDTDRYLEVVMAIGVPMEEDFSDIGMNARRAVIHLECDCEED